MSVTRCPADLIKTRKYLPLEHQSMTPLFKFIGSITSLYLGPNAKQRDFLHLHIKERLSAVREQMSNRHCRSYTEAERRTKSSACIKQAIDKLVKLHPTPDLTMFTMNKFTKIINIEGERTPP